MTIESLAKKCGIAGCLEMATDRARSDEAGELCPAHFFALRRIEQIPEPVKIPNGQRRDFFLGCVRIIMEVDREKLIAWRRDNPRFWYEKCPNTSHETH